VGRRCLNFEGKIDFRGGGEPACPGKFGLEKKPAVIVVIIIVIIVIHINKGRY
jgi:hypothetical protein